MILPRLLIVALLLGVALGISCYSEQQPPPTYRYPCESDTECSGDELCHRGLCERPCTQLEVFSALLVNAEDRPCPFERGYAGCYNGACASPCALDGDACPDGHTCLDVGLPPSGGGGPGAGSSTDVGVCTFVCDGDDSELCLPTEVCEEGQCRAIDCEGGEACPDDYTCLFGACSFLCAGGRACPEGGTCDPLLGICTPECSPECGEGFTCFFGACATNCSADNDCPSDLICLGGVCLLGDLLPDGIGTGGGSSTDDGATDDDATDDGATDDGATGDASSTGMMLDPENEEEDLR